MSLQHSQAWVSQPKCAASKHDQQPNAGRNLHATQSGPSPEQG